MTTYTDKQIRSFLMSIDMEAWSGSTPHIRGVGRILEALRVSTVAMEEAHYQAHAQAEAFFAEPGDVFRAMLDARMGEG